jgi:hypothetical protein
MLRSHDADEIFGTRSAVGPRILGRCSQVDLNRIAAERNGRPRQILGFTTP